MTTVRGVSAGPGLWIFTVCFLATSVSIETAYSWRTGLTDPYYLVKVVGWVLLASGAIQLRRSRVDAGLALLAAGYGWLAANFWRAVADRLSHIAAGQTLRLGSVELWFAGACLLVSLVGMAWSLALTFRNQSH
jgi:hypothetical protein